MLVGKIVMRKYQNLHAKQSNFFEQDRLQIDSMNLKNLFKGYKWMQMQTINLGGKKTILMNENCSHHHPVDVDKWILQQYGDLFVQS